MRTPLVIFIMFIVLASCSDDSTNDRNQNTFCISKYYNDSLSHEIIAKLPDQIESTNSFSEKEIANCTEIEINLILDLDYFKTIPNYEDYDEVRIYIERELDRSTEIIHTFKLNEDFILNEIICAPKINNKTSHIILIAFHDNEDLNRIDVYDNIILKENKQTIFNKTLNEFDFSRCTECMFDKIKMSQNLNDIIGKEFSMRFCIVGSPGECIEGGKSFYTEEEVNLSAKNWMNDYEELYPNLSYTIPCSGTFIYFIE